MSDSDSMKKIMIPDLYGFSIILIRFVCLCVCLFVGDELAQVVGCPWTMRDSGGSLAQNRWQGDLGLTAVGEDSTGGGGDRNGG